MAGVFDKLSDLHRWKLNWRFKVYVKRLYEHRFVGSHSFSLEGVRVHVSISSQLVKKWFGLINEFEMTKVKVVEEPSFPLDVFNFRPFTEILNADNVDESEMFDVIGEVVGKEEARVVVTSKGVHVKRMAIVLEDLGSNCFCCVLFGDLVNQILPHLNEESFDPESETWIFGKIVAICAGKRNWTYESCIKCYKKAERNSEGKYFYKKCTLEYEEPKNRYKVEVVAFDGTACITLLLWDRECKYLCEIEAQDLMKLLNDKDDDEHPIAFDKMLEMKLFFKINVKTNNIKEADTVYAVMKICDDDEMVQKYQPPEFEADACVSPNRSLEHSVNSVKSKAAAKKSTSTLNSCIKNMQNNEQGKSSTNRGIKKGQKKGVKRVRVIFDDTED
ncbi:hypothetical protein PIB30_078097 [Stylosanthes scabra]|uniref:Replication factor A C-terminal domain-containing protein n=1 Tax=Stylosanthes scabra TaxID=79078 RepID=A0ABU6TTN6_9FABA|nr:hypothetical protein [Stylosanthes scabra]